MSTISRRAFLKTVGVGALSVAAMSVLAGCEGLPTGTTEEVVTGAVEGKVGQTYLAGKYAVKVAAADDVTYNAFWGAEFEKQYKALEGDVAEDELKQAAINDANQAVKYDLAVVNFQISNMAEENLIVTTKSAKTETTITNVKVEKLESNSSYFSASCNGQSVPCAVAATTDKSVVSIAPTTTLASADNVTVYVALPVNAKEATVTVTLGGKTINYTVENKNANGKTTYVDLSKY